MRSAWKRNDPKIIKGNAGTGIYRNQRFFFIYLLYSPFPRPCLTFIKFLSEHFPTLLMEVISGLANQGYCIIMSTHSPEHPFSVGNKVLLMKSGKVMGFGSPKEIITSEALQSVYDIEMDVITTYDRYGRERTICLPVNSSAKTVHEK